MEYVVYHPDNIRIRTTTTTEAAAKRSVKAWNKKCCSKDFVYCEREHYDHTVNIMTTTYNMMDPDRKPIPIRLADKGGCCDPATETYHCM